jgi:predicted ferric reductase
MTTKLSEELEFAEQGMSFRSLILIGGALFVGTLIATELLPTWLPNLAYSMLGSQAKVFWFLSRGTALVSFGLLWFSMVFGLIITNHMARVWPGGPTAVGLHEYTSIIGLGFGFFHGLILMGDRYINYDLFQVLVPFASTDYRPVWVGIGQIAFYFWVLLVLSFYIRKRIGTKTWRLIHFGSFLTFLMVLLHGITSGTDTSTVWAHWYYWAAGGSLLFLTIYRIIFNIKLAIQPRNQTAPLAHRAQQNLQSQ